MQRPWPWVWVRTVWSVTPGLPPQVLSWKSKLPLQTIMRLLQVLVPQVEKICIDKWVQVGVGERVCAGPPGLGWEAAQTLETFVAHRGLTDESEILRFLQHGTLVGLLPVPHPILIRKYQANSGTAMWFRTYMWGVIYLRWASWGWPVTILGGPGLSRDLSFASPPSTMG